MNRWNARTKLWLALLFCVLGTASFFRGPLFFPKLCHIPYDLVDFHQPQFELLSSSIRSTGQLPWWNPYNYMGEPFYADVQAAMFYPPTLLTVMLGNLMFGRVTLWLIELELACHVVLAGIGMYVLLRMLKTSFFAALAGSAIYHWGAFFASQTQHLGAVAEAAWCPWLLAALFRLHQRRDWPSAALAGITVAMMILPGFPASYIPVFIFGPLLYGFWLWQQHPRPEWRPQVRAVWLLCAAFLLGMLLSAISWLPGYQVARHSLAAQRPAEQALTGFSVAAATSFFWPNLFGQFQGSTSLPDDITLLHLYQGVPALLLVFGGLAYLVRSSRSRPFVAAAAIAVLWMFGTTFFLSEALYLVIPGFVSRGIYPDFVLSYFSLFFAALAAFALDGWERAVQRTLFSAKLSLRLGLLAVIVALVVSAASVFSQAETQVGNRVTKAAGTLLLVSMSLGLCGLLMSLFGGNSDQTVRRRFSAALCAVIFVDLVAVGSQNRLNTYEWEGDVPPGAVVFLQSHTGPDWPYRIDTSDAWYELQTKPMQWQLRSANGMNPLLLQDVVTYRAPFSHLSERQFVLDRPDSPLLDLAGIRYIVTPRDQLAGAFMVYRGQLNVFENPRALRRFFLAGAAVGVDGIEEALDQINTRRVDPRRTVVVSAADVPSFAGINSPAPMEELGKIELIRDTPNECRLRITATRPAAFVATEIYTKDWHAMLDEAAVPLVRADGVFRAIPIPVGTHELRIFIRPRILYWAGATSVCGLLLIAGCFLVPALQRRNIVPINSAPGK